MKPFLRSALGLALFVPPAAAQLAPAQPVAGKVPSDLPLVSCLHQAWQSRGLPLERLRDEVGRGFVAIDDQRRIHVEIVGPKGTPAVPDALVQSFGGLADTRWRHRLDAWVPLERLLDLARALPAGHRVVRANNGEPDDVQGEGPMVTGSAAWRNGGANGAGRTIAVIDTDYAGLTMAINNGDAPASFTAVNNSGDPFEDSNTHGTGCVEAVFDHAPGANYVLYKIDSLADVGDAVDTFIQGGGHLITHSMSWYNEGWWDDEGDACDAALTAANAGVLFFTSAGNRAQQHWQGKYNPGAVGGQGSPDWHDWASGDELLAIQLPATTTLELHLSWNDDAPGTDDYDLFLFDTSGNVLASSESGFEFFEDLSWTNSGSSMVTVNVAVYRDEGSGTPFELFGDAGTWEYFTSANSTTSPTNSSHPNVVSVGAVDQVNFLSPPGTAGIIMNYSSQGPTNSGMLAPSFTGPTNTTGFTYPGGFGGTSGATPNAAGVAACLWSSVPAYDASSIRWLLHRQGQVFRDWGAAGDDQIYGRGGVNLVPFAPNTRWLVRELGNTGNLPWVPSYTLPWAQAAVPSGGRVLAFPGGDYPEYPVVLDKPLILDSAGGTAIFGD